jgi:putative glutamine amidotransferase
MAKKRQPRVALAYPAFLGMIAAKIPKIECVKLPRSFGTSDVMEAIQNYDMIVFSGGEDVNPDLYGELRQFSDTPNSNRDSIERTIANVALNLDKKIFAICRGHQLLNVVEGGNLWQDITLSTGAPGGHPGNHPLEWVGAHPIMDALKDLKTVNSMHHQGIRNWGNGVKILARYKNLPEITMMHQNKVLTVQWHPEFMSSADNLFTYLLEDWIFDDRKNPSKVSDEMAAQLKPPSYREMAERQRGELNFAMPREIQQEDIQWSPPTSGTFATFSTNNIAGTSSGTNFVVREIGTPNPEQPSAPFVRIPRQVNPVVAYRESNEEQRVILLNTLAGLIYDMPISEREIPLRNFDDLEALRVLNSVALDFSLNNIDSSDIEEEVITDAMRQLNYFNEIRFIEFNDVDEEDEEEEREEDHQ